MGLEAAIIWRPTGWCGISPMWEKLSNSGDFLKLLVPSYSRKAISGWFNNSCMVIIQKISERIMEYRGSKLVMFTIYITVKEQRVDGSWYKRMLSFIVFKMYSNRFIKKLLSQNPFLANNKHIGNTWHKGGVPLLLTRNLKLVNKLANKGLNITNGCNYTTGRQATNLICWWVAGFVDAEGCFRISATGPPPPLLEPYGRKWRAGFLKIRILRGTLDLHLFIQETN